MNKSWLCANLLAFVFLCAACITWSPELAFGAAALGVVATVIERESGIGR